MTVTIWGVRSASRWKLMFSRTWLLIWKEIVWEKLYVRCQICNLLEKLKAVKKHTSLFYIEKLIGCDINFIVSSWSLAHLLAFVAISLFVNLLLIYWSFKRKKDLKNAKLSHEPFK